MSEGGIGKSDDQVWRRQRKFADPESGVRGEKCELTAFGWSWHHLRAEQLRQHRYIFYFGERKSVLIMRYQSQ